MNAPLYEGKALANQAVQKKNAQYLADLALAQSMAWALNNPEQAARDMALCDEEQERADDADNAFDVATERENDSRDGR